MTTTEAILFGILTAGILPLNVKIAFEFLKSRKDGDTKNGAGGRNGINGKDGRDGRNGASLDSAILGKVIECPLDRSEITESLKIISQTLEIKDDNGIPLRFQLKSWNNNFTRMVELLEDIKTATEGHGV